MKTNCLNEAQNDTMPTIEEMEILLNNHRIDLEDLAKNGEYFIYRQMARYALMRLEE